MFTTHFAHALRLTLASCLLGGLAGCATPRRTEPALTADTFADRQAAAERGEARGQYQLGRCYAEGLGVAPDQAAAYRWFAAAAAQGEAAARFEVGFRLAHGQGVERNPAQALVWLRLAAGQQASERRVAQFYRERVDAKEATLNVLGGLLWMPLLVGASAGSAGVGR